MKLTTLLALALLTLACSAALADEPVAESPAEAPEEAPAIPEAAPATEASPASAPTDAGPSAEQVLQQMLEQVQESPVIEPTTGSDRGPAGAPGGDAATSNGHGSAVPTQADPRVLGTAPGAQQPDLRREGEFVVSRRGRLVHAPSGAGLLLVFESDSPSAPEPPMLLMPCQLLQSMEDLVRERGDKLVFIVTGQVFTYRGANYLLPTMMKLAIDRGNLEH